MYKIVFHIACCVVFFAQNQVYAQCPSAICVPNTASSPIAIAINAGIYQVNIGTINRNSVGFSEGYQNRFCSDTTNLFQGVPYGISINTGNNSDENVRIWIDYNNNGVFDVPQELVFSSSGKIHSGTVTVPATATLGTRLRMRIASDVNTAPVPTPCSTPQFSQTEDYGVFIKTNLNAPTANFLATDTITCTGLVQFNDLSANVPLNWFWDFGDGNTTTQQNPQHFYAQSGIYTVMLIVSNGAGSDTMTKTNYVTVNDTLPKSTNCTPITLNNCCEYGIYRVQLEEIDQESGSGAEGYKDFTCSQKAHLLISKPYTIRITGGTLEKQDIRVWLDTNNNGIFENNEIIFTALDQFNAEGTINIPFSNHLDTALRMRVAADFVGSSFNACSNLTSGQAEDYSIILKANNLPATANFRVGNGVNDTLTCQLSVSFENLSANVISSYLWKFGDGNTSTLPNPTHTYAAAGNYNVTLIAIGAFSTDSITKNINIFSTPPASCSSPTVPPYQVAAGILNVQFSGINHSSLDAQTEGYQDFTCSVNAAVITVGQTNTIIVQTFSQQQQQQVAVWIDWNANAQFEATERINLMFSNPATFTANITAPQGAIINTPLRMRVLQDVPNIASNIPCYNIANGQAEDYTVIIVPSNTPPIAAFSIDTANICRNPLQFNNLSTGNINSFLWKFGDGSTSTEQNPTHSYANTGTYTVTLIVSGILGTDSISKILVRNEIPIASTNCAAPSAFASPQTGIRRVTFAGINQSTASSTEGYKNFTCLHANVTVGQTYPISITTFSNFEQVAVWIDYNNNGTFEITERVIYSQTPTLVNPPRHNATINIPTGTVLNTPLRMRVIAAGVVNANSACGTISGGQAEDYSIVIQAANIPPTANFKVDTTRLCSDTIYFLNQSSGNISSYFWDFGNGQNSTAENPSVLLTAGTYDVKLKVSGSLGNDSITKSIQVLQKPVTTTCVANTSTSVAQVGIQRFVFADIDHTSFNAFVEGYQDFSCYIQSKVNAATSYSIQIRTFNNQERAAAWIDYNNDGNFAANEQVFLSNTGTNVHSGFVNIPSNVVFDVPLRMRVISRILSLPNGVPCIGLANGQAEDYGIIIRNPTSIVAKNNVNLGNLEIFPNPNSGIFTVKYQLTKERQGQLEVINTIGKVVTNMPILSDDAEVQVELKDYSKGVYFVRLITEAQTVVKKIVLQ